MLGIGSRLEAGIRGYRAHAAAMLTNGQERRDRDKEEEMVFAVNFPKRDLCNFYIFNVFF